MAFTKITTTELNSRGATTLPNQPTISATALKQEFDAPAKQIVAPKFNNLVDELEANTAASSLGAVAPEGRTGATVQAVMNSVSSSLATIEAGVGPAIEYAHTHENKDLLDTYTQTDEDIAQAIADDHTHENKALLDTYTQSESDLADAVESKHTHTNKDLLDTYNQTNADISDAVSSKHTHSNKALLDTYSQTESDLADAVTKKHTHSNKALLDTYTQTEVDLSDAVTKKHSHSNKSVIDKFSDVDGEPYYDGNPIGGGTVNDAYKTVKVGTTNIVASGQDTLEIKAGSNVTLTPDATNKIVTISATGGGSSSGDMLAADYDSDFDVKAAGGIKTYVASAISNKVDKVTGKGLSTNDYANEDKTIVGNAVTKSSISGLLKNDGTVDTTQYISDVSGKADKVSSATNGNFAALNSSGNLTDSGKKASDFMASDGVTANPTGTATGTLTKLGIGSDIYEIQGGGSSTFAGLSDVQFTNLQDGQIPQYDATSQKWVNTSASPTPDGSTVTPTDDIHTWLLCAGIRDKNYTTISQVLADSTTLLALISSNNAVDYMARSTTWASSVCSNSTAMTDIGANNYCADTLLADSTWRTAICNSTYFESVLNVKVPTMTSDNTPSGYTAIAKDSPAYPEDTYALFHAFDGNTTTIDNFANPEPSGKWLGIVFPNPVKIYKATALQGTLGQTQAYTMNIKVQYSDDGTTWSDATPSFDTISGDYKNQVISTDGNAHSHWRLYLNSTSHSGNTAFGFSVIQFYGRP